MIALHGYSIQDTIHAGSRSVTYRATRRDDETPVLIKVPRSNFPSPLELARLQHEFEISGRIADIEGIVTPIALEQFGNGFALVLEDPGGSPLDQRGELSIADFLVVAEAAARILARVHAAGILHLDMQPGHWLWNADDDALYLSGFGNASVLSRERQGLVSPVALEGSLLYISPEQTGRMNRDIDKRSDLYSLGAVSYEWLTGRPPFRPGDPMEQIHAHIAVQPDAPHELRPDVPVVLSNIVLKLLSKNAEDRYQSAFGLLQDLQRCRTALERDGRIEDFPVAAANVSEYFQLPVRLYGRDEEVRRLLDSFAEVRRGKTVVLLVEGAAGIGKTALVNEIHRELSHGYFVSGKFDQYKSDVPYSAIIQAFRNLIKQILTEPDERVESWRAHLLGALGSEGRLVIDVIPEVELILGEQPPVPDLPPAESRNRFNRVFRSFLRAFFTRENPLILFLDDLQWADSASLNLLTLLIGDEDAHHVFLMGAFRDSEVDETHPLVHTVDEFVKTRRSIVRLSLGPLLLRDVNVIVTDTVQRPPEECTALAEIVFRKTGGNPFFVYEFLKALHAEDCLKFDPDAGRWVWDIPEIDRRGITDNVVELLSSRIAQLRPDVREALKFAACIGSTFDLRTITRIFRRSRTEIGELLIAGLTQGLILPLGEDYRFAALAQSDMDESFNVYYRFAHDRVQQAAYSLMEDEQRRRAHLTIGRLLRDSREENAVPEERLITIVNHLNHGAEMISSGEERLELALLNHAAARKAHASTAYEQALKYNLAGIAVLPADAWEQHHALSVALHRQELELEYLTHQPEAADRTAAIILAQARDLMDRIFVYEQRIAFQIIRNRMLDALDIAVDALRLLGIRLPRRVTNLRLLFDYARTRFRLLFHKPADLAGLPSAREPRIIAAIRILPAVYSAAYIGNPKLLALLTFLAVRLFLRYGDTASAGYSYSVYGLILPLHPRVPERYDFGRLGLTVVDKYDANEFRARTLFVFASFIRPWRDGLRASIDTLQEAMEVGRSTGDNQYRAWSQLHDTMYRFTAGMKLRDAAAKTNAYLKEMFQTGHESSVTMIAPYYRLIARLRGERKGEYIKLGPAYEDSEIFESMIAAGNGSGLFYFHTAKATAFFLFGEYHTAREHLEKTRPYVTHVGGLALLYEANMLLSLSAAALFAGADHAQRKKLVREIRVNQKQLQTWRSMSPGDLTARHLLVEAELQRILGRDSRAMEYYEKAIDAARRNENLFLEGLSNELAGRYFHAQSRMRIAGAYLADARYAYHRWGASQKVERLDLEFPGVLSLPGAVDRYETDDETAAVADPTLTGTVSLDLNAVVRSTLALSREIRIENLMDRIMNLTMQFAGARRGLLLLDRDGGLRLEAEKTVDGDAVRFLGSVPLEAAGDLLPEPLILYVIRTGETVILGNAAREGMFARLPYIVANRSRSVLCMPIKSKGQTMGVLYLENDFSFDAFTKDKDEILDILASQAAVSLENAFLYEKATVDLMTGLKNRAYFQSRFREEWQRAMKYRAPMSLLVTDVDHFKKFNDSYGHQAGDEVLKAVAAVLLDRLRTEDFAARYGGEEFCLVLPGLNAAQAMKTAEAIRAGVEALQVEHEGRTMQVTLSVGVAGLDFEQDADSHTSLLGRADAALYDCKQNGRNQVRVRD